MHAEIDYTRKDATRHIVQGSASKDPKTLRMKLLRNLDSVRKNKPLIKSEVGSIKSIKSRTSNISARASQAQAPEQNAGRLSKIDEAADGEKDIRCECCPDH